MDAHGGTVPPSNSNEKENILHTHRKSEVDCKALARIHWSIFRCYCSCIMCAPMIQTSFSRRTEINMHVLLCIAAASFSFHKLICCCGYVFDNLCVSIKIYCRNRHYDRRRSLYRHQYGNFSNGKFSKFVAFFSPSKNTKPEVFENGKNIWHFSFVRFFFWHVLYCLLSFHMFPFLCCCSFIQRFHCASAILPKIRVFRYCYFVATVY